MEVTELIEDSYRQIAPKTALKVLLRGQSTLAFCSEASGAEGGPLSREALPR
jgi:hypothetical protein